ncbi:unnamed protein product [Vicia faba]|uniref:MORF/ORRM1/DAG-like MORF domain-containing protein n=1 Tax=Vicia faba TaxID=3906 RepID=A0AAV1AS06_VICFA|nr:unnamed protein product [Vicia faba]
MEEHGDALFKRGEFKVATRERRQPDSVFADLVESISVEAPYDGFFKGEPTKDDIIDSYVRILAELVGNVDEARMMVYFCGIITKDEYAFGTLLSQTLSDRVQALTGVVMIFDDFPFVRSENIDYEMPIPPDELEKLYRDDFPQQEGAKHGIPGTDAA